MNQRPSLRPKSPEFSSGPCRKYPTFDFKNYDQSCLGRSHRSDRGFEHLNTVVELTRKVHQIPQTHKIAIVPGSASGAIEMAMWNFLGHRPLTCVVTDVFSERWWFDVDQRLQLKNVNLRIKTSGGLPSLADIDLNSDILLNWNGSTSGVRFLESDLPLLENGALSIVDATSAAFTCALPWGKIDVTAFSWQKGLGSEAAHGVLVLGPRAIEHLETHAPLRPLPYIFSLRLHGKFHAKLFQEATLNTPSLMCVEDYRHALLWADQLGGISELEDKSLKNKTALQNSLDPEGPIQFLTDDKQRQSSSTMCLKIKHSDGSFASWAFVKAIGKALADEKIAYDIINHSGCPVPTLRIWGGPTVPLEDIEALVPWLYWAYDTCFHEGVR